MFRFLDNLYKSISCKKSYYSAGGIDALVLNIFKDLKKGIYLDIGCNHPIKANNTYLLYKKGWSGINIDLDQKSIDSFNYARPNDYNIKMAVSDKMSIKDFYFYHDKSSINTLSKETANYQNAKVAKILKIKAQPLNMLLDESPFKDSKIDFLSVDVEGSEFEILNGFNFLKFSPKVIVVEYLDLNLPKLELKNINIDNIQRSKIFNLIKSKNYSLVNILHSDLVFINNEFRD